MKHELLRELHACSDGLEFAESHETLAAAWDACERPDWMLWLLGRLPGTDKKKLVEFACRAAEHVLLIFESRFPEDKRPRLAIEAARSGSPNVAKAAAAAAAAKAAAAKAAAKAAAAAAEAAWAAAEAAWAAAWAAAAAAAAWAPRAAEAAEAAWAAWAAADRPAEIRAQLSDIRELFGNPFKN